MPPPTVGANPADTAAPTLIRWRETDDKTVSVDLARALVDWNRHRLALIHDMDSKKLERLVAGDFEGAMRHIANVDFGCTRFHANLLAIGQQ